MKYYQYKMNMTSLNIVATIFTVFLMIVYYILFHEFTINLETFILFILWLFLHEIVHGIAFMSFREVNPKKVVYGAKLESGIFYCMCKQRINKKVIFTSLLAPFTIIGIITFIISLIFNLRILAFLSLFNMAGSTGDLLMTLMFFQIKDMIYLDLDDCEGFTILSKDDLSKKKYFGFDLIKYGNDNNNLNPKYFKRFTCSKASTIILGVIFLLFVLSVLKKF